MFGAFGPVGGNEYMPRARTGIREVYNPQKKGDCILDKPTVNPHV